MTDDLVKWLREAARVACRTSRAGQWKIPEDQIESKAADRIEELEKRVLQAKIVFATMRSEMSNVCAVMKAFEDEQ